MPVLASWLSTVWAVLAAFLHCWDGFRLLVMLTPMSLSSSVTSSYSSPIVSLYIWLFKPTCMNLHFLTLNSIPQSSAHLHRLSRAPCSSPLSASLHTECPSFVSSANFVITCMTDVAAFRSLMKIRNSICPSTLPCGTPDSTSAQLELFPVSTTLCLLPVSQCCGTGTGTVGTVTFLLVEPEPESEP
jgi:hypothetical protein